MYVINAHFSRLDSFLAVNASILGAGAPMLRGGISCALPRTVDASGRARSTVHLLRHAHAKAKPSSGYLKLTTRHRPSAVLHFACTALIYALVLFCRSCRPLIPKKLQKPNKGHLETSGGLLCRVPFWLVAANPRIMFKGG